MRKTSFFIGGSKIKFFGLDGLALTGISFSSSPSGYCYLTSSLICNILFIFLAILSFFSKSTGSLRKVSAEYR